VKGLQIFVKGLGKDMTEFRGLPIFIVVVIHEFDAAF
jgi:hypothetical protein